MVIVREGAALVIFLATVLTIVARPSRIPEWLAAVAGVFAMVAVGAESASDALRAAAAQWDVLLFFAGLMTVVAVAESAGFFSWVAFVVARAANGSARRLFLAVVLACAIISALLTNDAAALLMTPLVFGLASDLRLRPLPFAFGCTFMANSASLVLPISNPVNLMIAESAHLRLGTYLTLLWLPSLAAVGATFGVLWIVLGRKLRRRFDESLIAAEPIDDPRYRSEVTALLALTAAALIAVSAAGKLVGVAACAAALVMLGHAALRRRLDARRVLGDANPTIVLLIAALFALTQGVLRSGLLSGPLDALLRLSNLHAGLASAMTAIGATAAANVFNNLPTAALVVAALQHPSMTGALAHRVAAGAIVGCDLGPNFTTVGSLSTMLWLVLLRRRGLEVSSLAYVKIGLLVAPVTVALAVGALLLTAR